MNEQKRRMLSEARFYNPGAVAEAAAARKVRDGWTSDRLLIVAADHTALRRHQGRRCPRGYG